MQAWTFPELSISVVFPLFQTESPTGTLTAMPMDTPMDKPMVPVTEQCHATIEFFFHINILPLCHSISRSSNDLRCIVQYTLFVGVRVHYVVQASCIT